MAARPSGGRGSLETALALGAAERVVETVGGGLQDIDDVGHRLLRGRPVEVPAHGHVVTPVDLLRSPTAARIRAAISFICSRSASAIFGLSAGQGQVVGVLGAFPLHPRPSTRARRSGRPPRRRSRRESPAGTADRR